MANSLSRILPLLLGAAATLHCGDDATIVTTTSDSTATATGTTTPSTSAAESTSTAGTSSSGETTTSTSETGTMSTTTDTTTDATTATTTTTTTTTTTDTTDSSTTADTEGSEDAEYAARFLAGGLDRIHIRKAEKISGLCTHIGLVWPGMAGDYAITTPKEWGVENIAIAENFADCLDFGPLAPVPVEPATAAGTVVWDEEGFCPPTLDIDVTLELQAGDLDWVPMKDQLFAEQLAIEGC